MTFIFTELFLARFRLTIHDRFTEGHSVARSDSVTSSHTIFSNTVANSCLSRSYTIQVKNAVVLEEKNRWHSMESVSARRCNFGHSSTLYNAFLDYFCKEYTSNHVMPYRKWYFFKIKKKKPWVSISRQNCIFGGFSPGKKPAILSSPKPSELCVRILLERDGWRTTIRLPKKMCRDATLSHSYTSRHPVNCLEVIQTKAIEKCNYTSSAQ